MLSGERNNLVDDFGSFEAVEDFSIFDGFSCANDDLDDFILNDAAVQQTNLLSVTYSYRIRIGGVFSPPVAFVSLANDSLKIKNDDLKARLGLMGISYHEFPAVKICRLGVSVNFQRLGIGSNVINTIKMLFLRYNRTGCRFVTVDAYNKEGTLDFYKGNDFQLFHDKDANRQTRSMYYDLIRFKTIP